jgi:hypothetical protein
MVVIETLGGIAAFVGAVWVAGRWVDRRPFGAFGLRLGPQWWRELFAGFLLGAVLISAVFGLEWLLGFLTVEEVGYVAIDGSLQWALTVSTLGYCWLQSAKNSSSGGICSRTSRKRRARGSAPDEHWSSERWRRRCHSPWSTPATAATLTSTAALGVLCVLFSVAYVYTGELALPIGLHLTWNVVQGPVYGFPVSGWPITEGSILRTTQHGPTWLTGGTFGPEAGLFGLGAMELGAACIIAGVRWLGRSGPDTSLATYEPSDRG